MATKPTQSKVDPIVANENLPTDVASAITGVKKDVSAAPPSQEKTSLTVVSKSRK